MKRRTALTLAACAVVVALAACDSSDRDATVLPSLAPPIPPSASATAAPPNPAPSASPAPDRPLDLDAPIDASALGPAPAGLGPFFTTDDEPLPAQTTGALTAAGGQALDVNSSLTAFGIYGIPRPSGASSAVMELDVTASRLAGTDGTSLSTEVLYMVSSPLRIDDLLVDAARTVDLAATAPPTTVPDYDGTTGDPRCSRLVIDTAGTTATSVEGCEYRVDPLTGVRSIGFRRLNLLVAGGPKLPPVFADVPAELLAAGDVAGYTASFGRPSGPSGNTVQLRLQIHFTAPLDGLGDGWQADGPGRWWTDTATVTVDAGTATWQSSSRAEP